MSSARATSSLPWVRLGHIDQFPEGETRLATFRNPIVMPTDGKTADTVCWVRRIEGEQFQVFAVNCAHLGCPVQPNGLVQSDSTKDQKAGGTVVQLTPVNGLAGFGCPCHGGAYDTEGNRTAGPPVRGLDRYYFAIRNGHLFLADAFSVKKVKGTGADAKIKAYRLTSPGDHIDDWEEWLYPVQPPS